MTAVVPPGDVASSLRRRLLIVVNDAPFFLSHRLPIAIEAKRRGYDVHIATPPSHRTRDIEAAGLTWHPIPLQRSGANPLRDAAAVIALVRLYRKLRPDVVHQVTSKPVLYGTLAARIARVPAVVNSVSGLGHVFISRQWFYQALRHLIGIAYRFVLRHPRMIVIFQNEDDRAVFVEHRWVRRSETVLIPGSGVDPDEFVPRDFESTGKPVVMFASRMLRTKGLPEFIDAVRLLNSENVSARYVLVGDPDAANPASVTERELRDWVGATGIELWGHRADMSAALREADIVCLPSHREGLPKVLIEAAACAIPIVTTDVPGCRDVVVDGENGFVVPAGDAGRVAAALRRLIEDSELRRRFGASGRKRVLEKFSLAAVLDATMRVYERLTA